MTIRQFCRSIDREYSACGRRRFSSAMPGMFDSCDGFVDGRAIGCGRRAGGLRSFDFAAAMFVFFAAATGAWLITPDFGFCNG
jgi:hypothetical protein